MKKTESEDFFEDQEEEVGGFPNLDKYLEGRARHWISYSEGAKMYYARDYEGQQSEDKKWHGLYLLSVPNDDGTEQDGWTKRRFKTFTDALEDSNPGYHFDWDESKFKGLFIGALFNEREYEKNDGSIGRTTNLAQVISVDRVRSGNYRLPDDKLLKRSSGGSGSSDDGFMNIPDGVDDELPFD